jgi:competence protein ComEC
MLCLFLYCANEPARIPIHGTGQDDTLLTVHFIDVGQGDCVLAKLPNGQAMLVDGGPESTKVVAYLRHEQVDTLERVVVTHPHSDHYAGLFVVLDSFVVETLYVNGRKNDYLYQQFLDKVAQRQVPCKTLVAGDTLLADDHIVLAVLHPAPDFDTSFNANEQSLVLKLSYGQTDFLLAGDIELNAEQSLAGRYGAQLACEVIKVPHHGSITSGDTAFLHCVGPQYAVISVGKYNDYGLPDSLVMASYQQLPCLVFRTDINGTVVFSTDGVVLTRSQ